MPLSLAGLNNEVTIRKINGNEEVKHHLGNLGFVVGAVVSIVNELDGNVIVSIKDSRVAISKSMAAKILV